MGQPPFAAAAREAALGWRFEPARRGDEPISARIHFQVEFHQEEELAPGDGNPPGARGVQSPSPAATLPPAPLPPAASPPIAVTVTGAPPTGSRTISRAFALQLPGAFGNPLAAIGASPGVTPTLSGAPYFYVRGSPPGNLGYLLDDLRLPALFHVLAGPSVVHPALIQSVDFFPGPYPARYGRFAGGIAAGQVRAASHALHGELNVRAFDSSGLVEVPLAEHTSVTLGGRVSYANPIARLFAPEVSVSYWDYQARLSHQLSPRDELVVFAFGSRDALDRTDDDGQRQIVFGAEFHRLQLRYERQLDAGSLRAVTVLGWDRSAQANGEVTLSDSLAQARVDLEQQLSEEWQLQAGLDVGLDSYTLELGRLDNPEDRQDYLERYPSRIDRLAGSYLAAEWRATPATLVSFGARFDAYRSGGSTALAPAASIFAQFEISPRLYLIHGLGVAHQPPSANVPEPGSNPVLGAGLQHALQSSAGLRLELPSDIQLEAVLFQMALFNLSDAIGISRIDNADESLDESSRALGRGRGFGAAAAAQSEPRPGRVPELYLLGLAPLRGARRGALPVRPQARAERRALVSVGFRRSRRAARYVLHGGARRRGVSGGGAGPATYDAFLSAGHARREALAARQWRRLLGHRAGSAEHHAATGSARQELQRVRVPGGLRRAAHGPQHRVGGGVLRLERKGVAAPSQLACASSVRRRVPTGEGLGEPARVGREASAAGGG